MIRLSSWILIQEMEITLHSDLAHDAGFFLLQSIVFGNQTFLFLIVFSFDIIPVDELSVFLNHLVDDVIHLGFHEGETFI